MSIKRINSKKAELQAKELCKVWGVKYVSHIVDKEKCIIVIECEDDITIENYYEE
ncbi:MAG: hypothetical protein ACRCX8_14335 [Sarcina sp.]